MMTMKAILARAAETGRLMCGVPDYDVYVAHMQANHPEAPVMTYKAFFRERQETRYGAGRAGRCC